MCISLHHKTYADYLTSKGCYEEYLFEEDSTVSYNLFWPLTVPSSAATLSALTSKKTELHLYLEKQQKDVCDFGNGVLLP